MRVRSVRLRVVAAAVSALALLAVSACSNDTAGLVPQPTYTPRSASPEAPASPDQSESPVAVRNDLARLPLKRTINAGQLIVRAEYTTPLALRSWRAERTKPLRVSLGAVNRRKAGQKIYLSKVTANVTAYDDQGQIGDVRGVSDTANITPGFIVTSPNTYNQSLTLPAVDSSSLWMTIDLTYELVLEVDKTKEGRDFAKQVATDTIVVPFAA